MPVIRSVALSLALFLCAPSALAAEIIFDAATSSTVGSASSLTFTHTATGHRLIIVVCVEFGDNTGARTVSTVTYGGQSLSLATSGTAYNGNLRRSEIWYLADSSTAIPRGANSVVVTMSASTARINAGAITLRNVNLSNPITSAVSATGATATPTVTVTTNIGERGVDSVCAANAALTVGAGQTERWNISTEPAIRGGASDETATGTSTVMSWSLASATDWAIVAVAVRPWYDGLSLTGVGK